MFPFGYVASEAPTRLWPFAMYAAFPRSDYYGHADCRHGHWGFSGEFPRPYLSLPLAFHASSPMFTLVDSSEVV
jgi:hypothetical protein